ncbi:class I SAM-dependent methyltransferase [Polymorphobacter sp.]|uniref:class I SAM-dependent methyltransferase n=1 Tax=Polymorphobacter sp. TaxID=1909290 RepID=UPI003F724DDE
MIDRGALEVFPRPARLEDESYLDFLESFRDVLLTRMFPAMAAAGHARMAEDGLPVDDDSVPLTAIQTSFAKAPIVPTWQRFMRSQQEMSWRRTRASFARTIDRQVGAMAAAAAQAEASRLVIDPDFHVPDYARREIHLQPGGYTDDPIGGIVYHYGTKVFYQGGNDHDELHEELASLALPPADGKLARILDLGCSIGQATTKLKARFPDAEIWGLDVGAPMVRYAHARAVAQAVPVNFIQALAEDMPFEDGHFDMVFAYILFHELPIDIIPRVLADVHRVLRPGGTFCIFEFPSASQHLPPAYRFMIDYDSRDNCEPYSPGFVHADFRGLLAAAGFDVADGPPSRNSFLQSIVATRR